MLLVLAALSLTPSDLIELSLASPGVLQYDDRSLPQVWQFQDRLFALDYNSSSGGIHPHGSSNNHAPWRHPGGTAGQYTSIKLFRIPPGTKIKVYYGPPAHRVVATGHYQWTYPLGTVFALRLQDKGRVFAQHAALLMSDGWYTEEETYDPPPGYRSPENCTDCHEDVGRHSRDLRDEDNYYGWLRGSHNRFSWHPFDGRPAHNNFGNLVPIRPNPRFSEIVDWSGVSP